MTQSVAVIVPWRGGDQHREAALHWMIGRFCDAHPDWPIILGSPADDDAEGFSRSQAIIDAAYKTNADMLVVSDADVFCDGVDAAVGAAWQSGWAVPHALIHRLSTASTAMVLAGADWHGLELSTDNAQDAKPYVGNETGTLLVIHRDVLGEVPPDRRFVGWGSEDVSWSIALRTLVGAPWRGNVDLVHMWHPPQPRLSRTVGSADGQALHRRYVRARGNRRAMRALLDEAQEEVAT